jgi:hypothetical protein
MALPFASPAPHESDASGVALPVQVYPVEGDVQVTVPSAAHADVVVDAALQQKLVDPAVAPAVPPPQESVASVCIGVALPLQVYPVEPEQLTEPSTAQVSVVVMVVEPEPVAQQNSVEVPLAVPELHESEALAWSGESLPLQVKPMTEAPHWTDVSSVHVLDDAV